MGLFIMEDRAYSSIVRLKACETVTVEDRAYSSIVRLKACGTVLYGRQDLQLRVEPSISHFPGETFLLWGNEA